jgi:hypothetical protein
MLFGAVPKSQVFRFLIVFRSEVLVFQNKRRMTDVVSMVASAWGIGA